eukprot:3310754-Amphidinium_carterae.1
MVQQTCGQSYNTLHIAPVDASANTNQVQDLYLQVKYDNSDTASGCLRSVQQANTCLARTSIVCAVGPPE